MRRISPPGAFYVRTRRTYACRIQHPAHLLVSAQRRHICAAARNNDEPAITLDLPETTHDQPPGYGSPLHVKYSDSLEHTTNPQGTDLRVHTRPTIRIRISATVKYSDILLKYSNNAAHFAARRILCENAPYVCMSYPASSTNISTCAAARNNERARDYIGSPRDNTRPTRIRLASQALCWIPPD